MVLYQWAIIRPLATDEDEWVHIQFLQSHRFEEIIQFANGRSFPAFVASCPNAWPINVQSRNKRIICTLFAVSWHFEKKSSPVEPGASSPACAAPSLRNNHQKEQHSFVFRVLSSFLFFVLFLSFCYAQKHFLTTLCCLLCRCCLSAVLGPCPSSCSSRRPTYTTW